MDSLENINILPTRGENKILPLAIDKSVFPTTISGAAGIPPDFNFRDSLDELDFASSKARITLTDYITIKVNNRKAANGDPFVFRFLINPESLNINRSSVDGQTMTRAGWQFGVWGEDFIKISGKGTTAGQYFARTLTDGYGEYTLSYRNLLAFMTLFENNGYWFEGESPFDNGPLASDLLRRRIKKHSDVVFSVGNFIWNGMFQSLTVSDTADTPYFNTFSFNFIAWKERYRGSSPWLDSTESNLYRGHAYEAGYKNKSISESGGSQQGNVLNNAVDSTPSSLSSSSNQTSYGLSGTDQKITLGQLQTPPLLDITRQLNGGK
jgi:hypothetical protein